MRKKSSPETYSLNPFEGCPSWDGMVGIDLDDEVAIPISESGFLVFPSFDVNPDGCDYVRIVKKDGWEEVGYWNYQEWEEDPKLVMGAILGLLCEFEFGSSGRKKTS